MSLPEKPTDEFADACKATFSSLADIDVRSGDNGNGPRKSIPMAPDTLQKVYVTNPSLRPDGDMPKFTGKTVNDLVDYLQFTGASFSTKNDGTAIDSASISVREMKEKLKPLVDESYQYLQRDWQFTEGELRSLIADNNTSEEALVLLMLTLKEYEGNISIGRCSPPKPGKTQPTESSFLKQAAGCALEAIGVNIVEQLIEGIIEEGAKGLTKTVIIKVFKKIAARYCTSIVGLGLAAYDWAHCMNYI